MLNHKKQILTEQSYEESEDNFEREARKLSRKFQTLTNEKCKLGFFAGFKEAERLAVGIRADLDATEDKIKSMRKKK